jgi:uncharacterized protein (TIGR00297 family)
VEIYQILITAILVNIPIGWVAVRNQSLRIPDGVIAAGLVGLVLMIVHPIFWLELLVFFGSSSLLTKYQEQESIKQDALSLAEKGGQRDSFQVIANSGLVLIVALVYASSYPLWSDQVLQDTMIFGVLSFAVVNADTWATELGVTSREQPYSILNPTRKVARGTSGGVSPKGLLASLGGAAVIAVSFSLLALLWGAKSSPGLIVLITLGGLLGSLIDSLLGATVQAQYYCPVCDKMTEKQVHAHCGGTITQHQRGFTWFNNDLVNVTAALMSSLFCLLLI